MRETSYACTFVLEALDDLKEPLMDTTSTPTFTLWISNYGGWDFDRERGSMTKVVFSSDEVAADYIGRKGYLVQEPDLDDEGYPAIPEGWDLTLAALFPTCEHGLSLRLCAGPGHYPMD